MTEVMERYKPEMVTAHDGVLYIRFIPDDAGAWVMHHQVTALQARVAKLEELVAYLCGRNTDHIQVALAGNPIVVDALVKRAEAALEGKKDE
jgi:hypothetical protein